MLAIDFVGEDVGEDMKITHGIQFSAPVAIGPGCKSKSLS